MDEMKIDEIIAAEVRALTAEKDAVIAELVNLTDKVVFGTKLEMGLLDCADGYYETSTWDSVKKLRKLINKHKVK
jgi:hypothetical protein